MSPPSTATMASRPKNSPTSLPKRCGLTNPSESVAASASSSSCLFLSAAITSLTHPLSACGNRSSDVLTVEVLGWVGSALLGYSVLQTRIFRCGRSTASRRRCW
jgi:hypothetical protein